MSVALFCQLYDQENEVVAEAIDVLQEACEDEVSYYQPFLYLYMFSSGP